MMGSRRRVMAGAGSDGVFADRGGAGLPTPSPNSFSARFSSLVQEATRLIAAMISHPARRAGDRRTVASGADVELRVRSMCGQEAQKSSTRAVAIMICVRRADNLFF